VSGDPSDNFELFTDDHQVELPSLPVTELVRLDTPSLYAIHDAGLIGTGECLYIGKTERPFEELYGRFVTPTAPIQSYVLDDENANTEPMENGGGSNYLYENTRVSVITVEDADRLSSLEKAAIGRVGPRYNTRSRHAGGYLDLSTRMQQEIDQLTSGVMVEAKVGGTYALISLGIPETDIEQGEPLKTGRTGNLISRLTDHVRNRSRESCLRTMLETEFPDVEWGAESLRSQLAVTFTSVGNYESEWQAFFDPRYPESGL
jgi:hypothetical protein